MTTYIDGGGFATGAALLRGHRPVSDLCREEVVLGADRDAHRQREKGLVHQLRLAVVLVAHLVPAEVIRLAAVANQLDADEGVPGDSGLVVEFILFEVFFQKYSLSIVHAQVVGLDQKVSTDLAVGQQDEDC